MKIRKKLLGRWDRIPAGVKDHLISAFHTFVPAFVSTFVIFFQSQPDAPITGEAFVALVVAAFATAARAGFKALSLWMVSKVK